MIETTERRWLRLTPDRLLLLALLPIWGLLFLCEHLRWLPKGYPVLLALASVVVIVVLLILWLAVALVFRWRFQFFIRSLLFLTVIVSIWGSWFGVEMRAAKRQTTAVEAVEKLGGTVVFDYQVDAKGIEILEGEPSSPEWLGNLLGDDLFTNVVRVWCDDIQVTDAGLEHLKGLTQLQWLCLSNTQVTDGGLAHLKGLTQLQNLLLDNTQVTDAGLEHLKGLTQLQHLLLFNTQVTDEGVKKLQQALPNCEIIR